MIGKQGGSLFRNEFEEAFSLFMKNRLTEKDWFS